MYTDAEKFVAAVGEGNWAKVSPEERTAIVDSLAGANLVRGTKNQPPLRHYERNGHLVVHTRAVEAAAHPDDIASS
jgi:hypothetical protein